MKVLFNTYQSAFQNPGGGEILILKLGEYLARKGVEIGYFNPWEHKVEDFDIVHHFSLANWEIWDLYKAKGKKLVVTPTTWPDDSAMSIMKERIKYLMKRIYHWKARPYSLRSFMDHVDMFLPTTDGEREKIGNFYDISDRKRFQVVPNGIDRPKGHDGNEFIGKHGIDRYALYVGRITPNKNVHRIIRACRKLDIPLFVVGEPDADSLEYADFCKREGGDGTVFTGYLPAGSRLLNDAYRGASVLVVASERETCSMVGLEAGAHGTPVSMTSVGGTREIFGNNVQYLDPEKPESIVSSIRESIHKNGSDENLKKHVLANYTWDAVSEKILAVYESILKK